MRRQIPPGSPHERTGGVLCCKLFTYFRIAFICGAPQGLNLDEALVMTGVWGRAGAMAHRWGSGGLHLQREEGRWGNKASKSLRAQVCHMSTPLSGDKRARKALLLAEGERESGEQERFLGDPGRGLGDCSAKDCLAGSQPTCSMWARPLPQRVLMSVQATGLIKSSPAWSPLFSPPPPEALTIGISVPIFQASRLSQEKRLVPVVQIRLLKL